MISPELWQPLADLGLSLVPGDLSKRPLTPWGRWRDTPQTDRERADLGLSAASVLGVVTGKAHGLVVLDFDGAEGVQLARAMGLTEPNTVTGSGGWHFWLEPPEDFEVKTCAALLGHPLDIRGEGGLVWTLGRSKKGVYTLNHTDKLALDFEIGETAFAIERPHDDSL